jgi:tetratricopeptide (TPR) repeat protein
MGQRIANPNAHLAKMDLIWEYDGPDVFQGTIIPPVATLERNVSVSLTPADSSGMADPWLSTEESIAPDANPLTVPTPPVTAPTPTAEMEQTEISPPTSGDNPPPAEELSVEEEPATNPPSNVEQLTLEQLRDRLEADPNFREQIAAQAGVNAGSDTESIIQALTKGINPATLDQDNYKHWFYFGVEKADQGHLEEAIAAWDKCLAIKPDLSSAWHNRGSALGHLNRLEEAISSFERAIEYNPEDFQAWNDKGIALFRQQKLEEAIYCWDKTLNLQPDFYQAWFNKGCLYENQGKYDEAKACYEQTLAIEPTFELASTRKQRLTELAPGETPSS